jgi:predicted O-methyltransferase YrrM
VSRRILSGLAVSAERAEKIYVDDQLNKSDLVDVASIPTHMTRRELASLYDLALTCPAGSNVVEIGSYYGASTCYIGTALRKLDGKLICVDTWANETMPEGGKDTFETFTRNTAALGSLISVRRKPSETLAREELPQNLAMVFIDGDHSYKAVKADVATTSPLIAANGLVVFHDVKWFQGVARVVGELLTSGEWQFDGSVDNLVWLRRSRPLHAED